MPRPRRLASRTGLRSSRLIPDSAEASPLRLHSRPPLHSGRPTVTDCSTVRLTSSPAPNQRQRVETASLGSAPAKAGAHPVPPTRRAATTPAPARKARSVPPHAPGALMLGSEQRPSNQVCGSFAKLTHNPNRTRASKRNPLRSPPGTSPARVAGDPGSPPSRRRRRHCGSPSHPGCVVSYVHRPSHVGDHSSSRSAVMRPASPARTTYLMPNMPSFGASPAPCEGTRRRHF